MPSLRNIATFHFLAVVRHAHLLAATRVLTAETSIREERCDTGPDDLLLCQSAWTNEAATFDALPDHMLFLGHNTAAVAKVHDPHDPDDPEEYKFPADMQPRLNAMFQQVVNITGGKHSSCQIFHGHGYRAGTERVVVFHTHEYCALEAKDKTTCSKLLPDDAHPSQGYICDCSLCEALFTGKRQEQQTKCPARCEPGADAGKHLVIYWQSGSAAGSFYFFQNFEEYLGWLIRAFDTTLWNFELTYLSGAIYTEAFVPRKREELTRGPAKGRADVYWQVGSDMVVCRGSEKECRHVYGGGEAALPDESVDQRTTIPPGESADPSTTISPVERVEPDTTLSLDENVDQDSTASPVQRVDRSIACLPRYRVAFVFLFAVVCFIMPS